MVHEVSLPEPFPEQRIRVSNEQHRYIVYDTSSGTQSKDEYTLDKAPVDSITEVTGTVNGKTVTFTPGIDYKLSNDDERIVWLGGGDSPDRDTIFYVDYEAQPIIERYVESHNSELDTTKQSLQDAIDAKFVEKASGSQLDNIGSLFGEIGRRLGRSDSEYRTYLKQIVDAYKSRGTKSDIKKAVAVTEGVPETDINIIEDFQQTGYKVEIPWPYSTNNFRVRLAAEITDPSGVELLRIIPPIESIDIDKTDAALTRVRKFSPNSTDVDRTNASDPFTRVRVITGVNSTDVDRTTASFTRVRTITGVNSTDVDRTTASLTIT